MADIGTLSPEQMLQQQQILRQQKMAEMLMQQGMQQPQSQMVSGRYVAPSIFQNLAGLANTYVGQKNIEKADQAQIDLAKQLRNQYSTEMENYLKLQGGTPAVEGGIYGPNNQLTKQTTPDMYGADMQLNPQYRQVASAPAVPANPMAANLYGSTAYNPVLQQLSTKKLLEGPKWKEVSQFNQQTGNTENYRYDENSSDPKSTMQFLGVSKPAISPEAGIRFADENIAIPSQYRGGAVPMGQPSMQPQGAPQGQPMPATAPVGSPSVTPTQGYDYFKAPPVPTGLSGKQAREFVSEQNKPLTGKPAEQVTGAINYQKSLDKVQNLLDTYKGPQLLDPNVRAQFKAAIRTAQLQGKEAFGLGVLNGPDLDILEQVITDPTAFDSFLKDRSTINKLYNNQREFTSEAIKTSYRSAQKAIPTNLRDYVEIKAKELTPDSKDGKPKSSGIVQRAILNNQPIETRNGKWVYSKTGKAVE